jgi:two-component system, NtrC family, sensor kinase
MSKLASDYLSAIEAHLDQQSEASLTHAYELGRNALEQGLGILDILSLYESIQKEVVLAAPADAQLRMAVAVANFFRELLSPFEMSLRGYREANSELRRLNEDLTAAYADLQTKQVQLVQSAKMASLGELVAGIAHEVNNPLAFVVSHLGTAGSSLMKAELVLGDAPSHEAKEHLARARDRLHESALGAQRIRDLVLKLRSFSRLDEGERKQASIAECVGSVLTILQHRFEDRIRVETHLGHPDTIECFPSLLNQALMNLVSNAIDAIEHQGVIGVTTGADGDVYVIAVTDTGHGIAHELQERVFEPFFTTKPLGRGTGLGLSITYSIVQSHGGTLALSARNGGGTVATIRLPLRWSKPAESVEGKSERSLVRPSKPHGGSR